MSNKNAFIIAGPNGAGKTTFATEFLSEWSQAAQVWYYVRHADEENAYIK